MESEVAHMAQETNEIQEKFKKKLMRSTVLDSFTKLTSDTDKIRVTAGANLLKHLNSPENTDKRESEHTYTLDRLVRGVGSSRSNAKTGFYSVLVALLTNTSLITTENVLEAVKKHLSTGGKNSKSENADISMGQILVCGALIHSEMFMNATEDEQKQILEMLFTAGKKRSYLSLAAYSFAIELLEKINEEQFKVMWEVIKPEVSKPWKEQTLDTIHLLLIARNKFPSIVKSKFFKKVLEVPEIVHEDCVKSLCDILLNVPLLATIKHPIYPLVAKQIVDNALVAQWCAEMDIQLQKPNRNKHLVVITILILLLENLTDASVIPDMLTNNFIKNTLYTFKHMRPKDRDVEFLNKADTLFKTLIKKLESTEIATKTKISVLKKLLFYPGSFIFEKTTKSKLIQHITIGLNAEGVKKLSKLYKEVVTASKPKVVGEGHCETWINLDRSYAAQLMVKLLGHSSVQKEVDWRLEQVKFFMKLGLLNDDTNVGVELAASLKECFYRSLDQRLPKLEDLRNLLSSLVHHINDSIFINSESQLRTPLTEEGVESWKEMMSLVAKLEGKQKFKHSYAVPVFHTLLLHMGLQLFSDYEMAQSALKELHSCFNRLETEKTPKKHKLKEGEIEDSEPVWVEVVVDLFLSLLSHNSHLLRTVIGCVFPYLCPRLTLTAIRQILDVLDPKNESNPLSKHEESDSSDDENEDESEDEEDDTQENGVEDEESDEESDDSGLEEEENEDDEHETNTDKLRLAVREALHKSGYQTDDDSEDMDGMDEDEGKKLDKALADAFKQVKKNNKGKKTKQNKDDKSLTHFRIRVLDLIDMYLDSEPSMLQCLEIACLLLQTLEYSIRDPHQKPLEQRLRSCLKKLSAIKKFSSTEDITEDVLATMLNSFLDKGSKGAFIYQDMGDIIAECCMLIIRCSQMLNSETESQTPKKSKKKQKTSKILEIFKNSLETFFKKRDCLLPVPLFKNTVQISWDGNWSLVPLLVDFAFDNDIRPFRRSQALEFLKLFYNNSRFRTANPEEFKVRITPLEKQLSEKTIELLQNLSANPKECKIKEKFVYFLLNLLTAVKSANGSDSMDWTTIGESVRNYRSHVTLAKDAKLAYNKLCRTLGISNLVKMQIKQNIENGNNDDANEDSDSENESQDNENKRKDKKRKKTKSQKKDTQKLKKEARMLRLKASSEGLETDVAFSNVSLTDIKIDPIEANEESEIEEPKQKKSKKKNTNVVEQNGHADSEEETQSKTKKIKKKNKVIQNGDTHESKNNGSPSPKKRYNSESDDRSTKKKQKKIK